MNKPLKILLGMATIWPAIYMVLFFVTAFSAIFSPGGAPTPFPIGSAGFIAAHLFTMLLSMGLMAFYIFRVVKSDRLDNTRKIIWTLLIFMAGAFAMPVFWYLHVWREQPVASEA